MRLFILIACLLHVSFAAPQFVTFKDGKIGVNFGGYHADAGLGGLLTGNAAHGGLSASAGTPWGPQAAAGIGGALNGPAAGAAYAGAQANPNIGASALLSGNTDGSGFAGSEAHANGKVSSSSIGGDANTIQKIKPPKKYLIKNEPTTINADANVVHTKQVVRTVHKPVFATEQVPIETAAPPTEFGGRVHLNSNVVTSALQIPIGILRSLQESLSGLSASKTLSITQQSH